MVKTILVDGKKKAVMVLRETDDSYVYISLHHIDRIDYARMMKLVKESDDDLLTALRDTRFDNGMLGLNLYKDVILVAKKHPHEMKSNKQSVLTEEEKEEDVSNNRDNVEADTPPRVVNDEPQKKPRRRPGRPPGSKNKSSQ